MVAHFLVPEHTTAIKPKDTMRTGVNQTILRVLGLLILSGALLAEKGEAAPALPHLNTIVNVSWREIIPFQPPERWFSPNWEDDEWYQRYQEKKYRKRG